MLTQELQAETFDGPSTMKQVLGSLLDAVLYTDHASENEQRALTAEEDRKAGILKLEDLIKETSKVLKKMVSGIDEKYSLDLSKQIMSYVTSTVEQGKTKLNEQAAKLIAGYNSVAQSEKTKAAKSLEAFMAATPLPVLDKVIGMNLVQGIYEASVRYRCEGAIEYDFWLAAKNVSAFRQPFTFSLLRQELKVPVKLVKAWGKKELIPSYERLDRYILLNVETSVGGFIATFASPETDARIKIFYSKRDDVAFITLEYTNSSGTLDVTGEPTLHKHLDLEKLKASMEELLLSIKELEKYKLRLTKLASRDDNILAKNDYYGFLMTVVNILSPRVKDVLSRASSGSLLTPDQTKIAEKFDLNSMLERLRLLGPRSRAVAEVIGLQNHPL